MDLLSINDISCAFSDSDAPQLSIDRRSRIGKDYDRRLDRRLQWHCDRSSDDGAPAVVDISPPKSVQRRAIGWQGMAAEFVKSTSHDTTEYRFRAPMHLLAAYERGVRRQGETIVEGLPRSTLRDLARKLTFVPAQHEYREWQEPRTLTSLMYFYFDPTTLQGHSEFDISAVPFAPRVLFEDATLWDTALKLKRSVESPTFENRLYSEALAVVLVHELVRLNLRMPRAERRARGGLAAWHQRVVAEYIEEHVYEQIPLATLAQLVDLSPYHFCRAFKESFGVPPHRYHTARRIARAKMLLADSLDSVTNIGLTVGFSETSSFSAAFRKATGLTPTGYRRRSLD
jgi:AraC family transcriptional regulator